MIVPVDSSKFGQTAPIFLGRLAEIHLLVTDRIRDAKIAEMCKRDGVRYIETDVRKGTQGGVRLQT